MKKITYKKVWLDKKWQDNVCFEVDDHFIIQKITKNYTEKDPQADASRLGDDSVLIPGFSNAHSHSFQYAMVGLTEKIDPSRPMDDFWSWRTEMYQLAQTINPSMLYSITKNLYRALKKNGFVHVHEFHYLHHQSDGTPYHNPLEMCWPIIEAAQEVDIQLTLIPVFYERSNFDGSVNPLQKRFYFSSLDPYLKLVSELITQSKSYSHLKIGYGVHSLRAARPEMVKEIFSQAGKNYECHMHIAEQTKEVDDSINFLKKRPVEWFLDNVNYNDKTYLIHATHMNTDEIKHLAQSPIKVVLCPSTEGNLGDGIFPLVNFWQTGGKFLIGTDSHVGINPWEELRWLDYTQRMIHRRRNIFYREEMTQITNTAEILLNHIWEQSQTEFSVGRKLDGIILSDVKDEENVFSKLIYGLC